VGLEQSAEGTEIETSNASRRKVNGEVVSPPQSTRMSGVASWAPPTGSGTEPRPKTVLVHFQLERTNLMKTNFVFYFFCDTQNECEKNLQSPTKQDTGMQPTRGPGAS